MLSILEDTLIRNLQETNLLEVFKFGGSVVTDATALKKIATIILGSPNAKYIVLSATFNTTNRLENIHKKFCIGDESYVKDLTLLLSDHLKIARDLSLNIDESLEQIFFDYIKDETLHNLSRLESLDSFYSIGEIASSFILASYLKKHSQDYKFLDIRDFLVTNSTSNHAAPMLYKTKARIAKNSLNSTYITQGFIGRSKDGKTRTLGREGSDFTGAILAWCIDADALTIWKDVDGIYNCDPIKFKRSQIIRNLSYRDASLLTEKGAKVLFSRTMEPLERHGIKLFVRSIFSEHRGTEVGQTSDLFYSITSKKYDLDNSLISVVFDCSTTLDKFVSKLGLTDEAYEEGPTFLSFLVKQDNEENSIEKLLEDLGKLDCK